MVLGGAALLHAGLGETGSTRGLRWAWRCAPALHGSSGTAGPTEIGLQSLGRAEGETWSNGGGGTQDLPLDRCGSRPGSTVGQRGQEQGVLAGRAGPSRAQVPPPKLFYLIFFIFSKLFYLN